MVDINVDVDPPVMKAFARNEASVSLSFKNDSDALYWCECEVKVAPPLTLARGRDLKNGLTKVGIIKPNGSAEKKIKVYTSGNSFPDTYEVNVTAFLYDETGSIAQRVDHKFGIECRESQLQGEQ
ncbi:MAG: hypothetical protein M1500_01720 [Candidatus Marsarchaeota archaeon]|nr:hypothetical protein [Candidatus Marsarchaeota archaeon]MCL5112415.1 hypothetical protein [Candidatus Marsarchaeota archaeon]